MPAVLWERSDGVGSITLNRPEAMNTFNTELAAELNDALRTMESDDAVRAVVLSGAGKHFSTGIDLREYLTKERHEIRGFLSLMNIHNHTLAAMTKPVIAYIAGLTAPKGRTMGHAGAIISAFGESASEKVEILTAAGVTVAENPSVIGETVARVMAKRAA